MIMAFGEFESNSDRTSLDSRSYDGDGTLENDFCIKKSRKLYSPKSTRTEEPRDMVTSGCDSSCSSEKQNKCDSVKSPKVSSTSSAELSALKEQMKKTSSHSSSPDTTVREFSYHEGNTRLSSELSITPDESKTLKSQKSTKFCNAERESCDLNSSNGVGIMSTPSSHQKQNSKRKDDSTEDDDDTKLHSKNSKYSKRTESSCISDVEQNDKVADNVSEKLRKRSRKKCISSSSSKESKRKRSPGRIPKSYMKYYNSTVETKRFSSDSRTSHRSSSSSQRIHSRRSKEGRTTSKSKPIGRRTHNRRRHSPLSPRERDTAPLNSRSLSGIPGRTHFPDNFGGSSSVLTSPIVACSNCRQCRHQALAYFSANVTHGAQNGHCVDSSRNWHLDCKVYIGGLNEYATRQEIRRIFSKYGNLKNLWIAKNPPGFAFVEYVEPKDARHAVRMVNGKTVCGTRVKVQMSNGLRHSAIRMSNGLSRHVVRVRRNRNDCRVYRRRQTT